MALPLWLGSSRETQGLCRKLQELSRDFQRIKDPLLPCGKSRLLAPSLPPIPG